MDLLSHSFSINKKKHKDSEFFIFFGDTECLESILWGSYFIMKYQKKLSSL